MNLKNIKRKSYLMAHGYSHKKLYKSGKLWLIGTATLLALTTGTAMKANSSVHADTTNSNHPQLTAVQTKNALKPKQNNQQYQTKSNTSQDIMNKASRLNAQLLASGASKVSTQSVSTSASFVNSSKPSSAQSVNTASQSTVKPSNISSKAINQNSVSSSAEQVPSSSVSVSNSASSAVNSNNNSDDFSQIQKAYQDLQHSNYQTNNTEQNNTSTPASSAQKFIPKQLGASRQLGDTDDIDSLVNDLNNVTHTSASAVYYVHINGQSNGSTFPLDGFTFNTPISATSQDITSSLNSYFADNNNYQRATNSDVNVQLSAPATKNLMPTMANGDTAQPAGAINLIQQIKNEANYYYENMTGYLGEHGNNPYSSNYRPNATLNDEFKALKPIEKKVAIEKRNRANAYISATKILQNLGWNIYATPNSDVLPNGENGVTWTITGNFRRFQPVEEILVQHGLVSPQTQYVGSSVGNSSVIRIPENSLLGTVNTNIIKEYERPVTEINLGNSFNMHNMQGMFLKMFNLRGLHQVGDFDTSHVTNMSSLFKGDMNLKDISGLRNWNTHSVMTLDEAFAMPYHHSALSDLSPLSNWDTSNLQTMANSFVNLSANFHDLTPFQNWDTSHVFNMSGMFANDKGITDLTPIGNWDTDSVIANRNMFYGDHNIQNKSTWVPNSDKWVEPGANGHPKIVISDNVPQISYHLPNNPQTLYRLVVPYPTERVNGNNNPANRQIVTDKAQYQDGNTPIFTGLQGSNLQIPTSDAVYEVPTSGDIQKRQKENLQPSDEYEDYYRTLTSTPVDTVYTGGTHNIQSPSYLTVNVPVSLKHAPNDNGSLNTPVSPEDHSGKVGASPTPFSVSDTYDDIQKAEMASVMNSVVTSNNANLNNNIDNVSNIVSTNTNSLSNEDTAISSNATQSASAAYTNGINYTNHQISNVNNTIGTDVNSLNNKTDTISNNASMSASSAYLHAYNYTSGQINSLNQNIGQLSKSIATNAKNIVANSTNIQNNTNQINKLSNDLQDFHDEMATEIEGLSTYFEGKINANTQSIYQNHKNIFRNRRLLRRAINRLNKKLDTKADKTSVKALSNSLNNLYNNTNLMQNQINQINTLAKNNQANGIEHSHQLSSLANQIQQNVNNLNHTNITIVRDFYTLQNKTNYLPKHVSPLVINHFIAQMTTDVLYDLKPNQKISYNNIIIKAMRTPKRFNHVAFKAPTRLHQSPLNVGSETVNDIKVSSKQKLILPIIKILQFNKHHDIYYRYIVRYHGHDYFITSNAKFVKRVNHHQRTVRKFRAKNLSRVYRRKIRLRK